LRPRFRLPSLPAGPRRVPRQCRRRGRRGCPPGLAASADATCGPGSWRCCWPASIRSSRSSTAIRAPGARQTPRRSLPL